MSVHSDHTEHDLEFDLTHTDWIIDKVCADTQYAQHLYAALCNNEFVKNDVWPILRGSTWMCSWRHAGAIIADIQDSGSYMDWYCSGIGTNLTVEEIDELSEEERAGYMQSKNNVGEGHITDEVRQDLFKLGWIPVTVVNTKD